MCERKYYEKYWEGDSIPDLDPSIHKRIALLRKYAGSGAGRKALDLGCGSGGFSAVLRSMGFDTCGVDISSQAVRTASAKYPDISFQTYDSNGKIPLEDESCDLVWCGEVLEHIFDVHDFLSDLNRVLKGGATLILTTPYHGLPKNLLITLLYFSRHFDPYISHIRFFNKSTLAKCLEQAGLRPKKWSHVGRFFPLYKSFFVCAEKIGKPGEPPKIIG